MVARFSLGVVVLVAACAGEPTVRTVEPASGSVAGGTRVTLRGANLGSAHSVTIAGSACTSLAIESDEHISCTTGATRYVETVGDIVVATDHGDLTLPDAFTYSCPWETATGRRTCGAAPPTFVGPQVITSWISDVEDDHGFVTDDLGRANLDDTSDFVNGERSVWIETDGAGTPRLLANTSLPGIDMTDQLVKVWVKVDQLPALARLDLRAGNATLTSYYAFRLSSTQGQQWLADGEWVSFTLSWSPDACDVVGEPDRTNIRAIALRVVDDATGIPVRVHLDGLALVPQPMMQFPRGVLSFTFDDNHDDMVAVAAPELARHSMPATAYAIVDMVDRDTRASLADLHVLQDRGWDVAAHAFTSIHHDARFPTLPSAVVEDELVDTRAWLMANGFRAYDHCAYPGGDFSNGGTDITPIAERYFASCRTIYQRQREAVPPADPIKLRVFYVTSATTLDSAMAAVDHARDNHEWIILVFHKLVDTVPTVATEWPASHFAALVDHVAASGIRVEPVSRVLAAQ